MNTIDGSEHYEKTSDEPTPSLLTIVLDTNPRAWALLSDILPLSKAVANILVFINAHLAINHANEVAVIASHTQCAEFLYPPPLVPNSAPVAHGQNAQGHAMDIEMADAPAMSAFSAPRQKLTLKGPSAAGTNGVYASLPRSNTSQPTDDANIYRPFHQISIALYSALNDLMSATTTHTVSSTASTSLAGALTLALTYINKQTTILSASNPTRTNQLTPVSPLNSRILVLSVSTASPTQYIPLMNTIFASQRLQIPIDILALAGSSSFLQQASDATNGIYLSLSSTPTDKPHQPPRQHGLLQYLLLAFLPDQTSRAYLVPPTHMGVDFRAACFCHRRVVDIGFVCSICLSIFCKPPEDAACLTCGTHLRLGDYGVKPAVVARKKKKKKVREGEATPGTPRTPATG